MHGFDGKGMKDANVAAAFAPELTVVQLALGSGTVDALPPALTKVKESIKLLLDWHHAGIPVGDGRTIREALALFKRPQLGWTRQGQTLALTVAGGAQPLALGALRGAIDAVGEQLEQPHRREQIQEELEQIQEELTYMGLLFLLTPPPAELRQEWRRGMAAVSQVLDDLTAIHRLEPYRAPARPQKPPRRHTA
jgi:hypothetical protein